MSPVPPQERFNVASHGLGALGALVGLVFLLLRAGTAEAAWAFGIYGVSLVALFAASTVYHAHPESRLLNRIDHVCIYLLIAGTYTPPSLLSAPRWWGIPLLVTIWTMAAVGVLLEVVRPPRSRRLAVILYVVMGWTAILALPGLLANVSAAGNLLIIGGGVVYTLGAVIYALRRPDPCPRWLGFHGLWHLFVLAGGGLHFACMAFHVPAG